MRRQIADVPAEYAVRAHQARSAVIGAGTMGGGIAMNFLNAGIPVTLLEINQEALDKGVATIRRNYESTVKKEQAVARRISSSRMALLSRPCPTTIWAAPISSSRRCSRSSR